MGVQRERWGLCFGAALVALSAALYLLHYAIFRDARHLFIYFLGDIAFLPVEVLLVTLIIHRLLTQREKRAMLTKLNMVIGAFFSEVGTGLLARCAACTADAGALRAALTVRDGWKRAEFDEARARIERFDGAVKAGPESLAALKGFLSARREFLLRLLENPNLLEHESFTDLLWAVLHLAEELDCRTHLGDLAEKDREHLGGDIRRAFRLLLVEWLAYLGHLKDHYPYLFSLAVRTNPFDPQARPELV
jgi:hypothetical protein